MWSSLLNRLEDDQAPDLPPHISPESLSAQNLQFTVLSGVRGKLLWEKAPKLARIEELHLQDTSIEADPSRRVDARLLPGGKYVLIDNCGALELWSLASKRRLWTASTHELRDDCVSFDFEVVDGGTRLMVATVLLSRASRSTSVFSMPLFRDPPLTLYPRAAMFVFSPSTLKRERQSYGPTVNSQGYSSSVL